MDRVRILIIAHSKEEAVRIYKDRMGNCQELFLDDTTKSVVALHPMYLVCWFPQGMTSCCAARCNFIIAHRDTVESEWFRAVIQPMLGSGGVCIID